MKVYQNITFLTALNLFLVNQILEYCGYHIPYVHAYLDDLLCMPVVLSFALIFQRKIVLRNPTYIFSIWHIIVAVVYCTLLFEWWLPSQSSIYTADVIDVLFYTVGAYIFYACINR